MPATGMAASHFNSVAVDPHSNQLVPDPILGLWTLYVETVAKPVYIAVVASSGDEDVLDD